MSEYRRYECEFIADKKILLAGLDRLGLKYETHEDAVPLIGFQGDRRKEKAEIVIRRESLDASFTNSSNDIGFHFNEKSGAFEMIISEYDQRRGLKERILQAYAATAIEEAFKKERFRNQSEAFDLRSKKIQSVTLVGRKMV